MNITGMKAASAINREHCASAAVNLSAGKLRR